MNSPHPSPDTLRVTVWGENFHENSDRDKAMLAELYPDVMHGAIAAGGTLTVERSTLSGNTADGSGGAISRTPQKYSNSPAPLPLGSLTVRGSVISGNSAAEGGGISDASLGGLLVSSRRSVRAAEAPAPSVSIDTTTIAQNTATDQGGGVALAITVHTAYHLGEIRQALCTLR